MTRAQLLSLLMAGPMSSIQPTTGAVNAQTSSEPSNLIGSRPTVHMLEFR